VHDPATNLSLARSAHSRYAGSRLLTITGKGDHGIYGGVNKCADKIVNTLPIIGKAPAKDTTCAAEGIPPDRAVFHRLCRECATEPRRRIHPGQLRLSALIGSSRREITALSTEFRHTGKTPGHDRQDRDQAFVVSTPLSGHCQGFVPVRQSVTTSTLSQRGRTKRRPGGLGVRGTSPTRLRPAVVWGDCLGGQTETQPAGTRSRLSSPLSDPSRGTFDPPGRGASRGQICPYSAAGRPRSTGNSHVQGRLRTVSERPLERPPTPRTPFK
jgi:hypothetical protein